MRANTGFSCNPASIDPLILVAEITHRVFNEYSQVIAGIRVAAKTVASSEARAILAMAELRLLSFAEAHRALQAPRSGESIDLADYLERLCEAMTASCLEERGVRLVLTADAVTLPAERCWRVALIVSELITNGVRHGLKNGPGRISVEVGSDGVNVACRVIDNGSGSPRTAPGRGFAVVTGLAEELGGTVKWRFTPAGTTAELTCPYKIEELRP